jgi:hypothetical protein
VLAASALALVLAGCSGRDTEMAEKLARAEAAAARAESAAIRAEAAAKRVTPQGAEPAAPDEQAESEPQADEPAPEPEPPA